jgi:hypothetical protein
MRRRERGGFPETYKEENYGEDSRAEERGSGGNQSASAKAHREGIFVWMGLKIRVGCEWIYARYNEERRMRCPNTVTTREIARQGRGEE